MRYISMHKATPSMEAGELPSEEVMAGMGPLIGEMAATGIFLAGEGLRPSSEGVRLTFSGGKRTIRKGPLTGSNELTAAFGIVNVRSIDEAIEWASRFAGSADAEIDVRPVTEEWDLGFAPAPPPGTPRRFMILRKADRDSESGRPPALRSMTQEMSRAGVLVTAEALRPSAEGIRLKFVRGNQHLIDGPFTESKELIAGYSITEIRSIEEAIHWSARFARLIGDVEIDIRPLYEPDELQ